jgi:predicted RNA-binding protein YlxR (DUF448 family)
MPEPLRRCVVTRQSRPAAEMVRFVIREDGGRATLAADLDGRAGGRGLWVTARRDIVSLALAGGAFRRAARRALRIEDGLIESMVLALTRRCAEDRARVRRAARMAEVSQEIGARGPLARRLATNEARLAGLRAMDTNAEAATRR